MMLIGSLDIPLPDRAGRLALLDINLKGVKRAPDVDLEQLATRTEGFSGADISLVRSSVLVHVADT